jgi:hypothetical protein
MAGLGLLNRVGGQKADGFHTFLIDVCCTHTLFPVL